MFRFVFVVAFLIAGSAAAEDYVVKQSSLSVADAAAKIEAAIEAAPPMLMAKIDHGANAKKAGLELGDSILLVLGAPKVGTPIMQANPMAGLELPAKILIWSEGGQTRIGYLDPKKLDGRFSLGGKADKQLGGMAGVLGKLSDAGVM